MEKNYIISQMLAEDNITPMYPATIVDAIVTENGKDLASIVHDATDAAAKAKDAADKADEASKTIDSKVSGKADKTYVDTELGKKQNTIADLSNIRSGASSGATAVQPSAISDMETKTHASATYQPKGNYLTEHQSLADYAKKSELPTKTSELTNDSGYLTSHQDISGKADKTYVDTELGKKQNTISDLSTIRSGASAGATAVQPSVISDMETKTHASATYQPKGNYLTSHQSLANYYTKTEIDSMITATLTANY